MAFGSTFLDLIFLYIFTSKGKYMDIHLIFVIFLCFSLAVLFIKSMDIYDKKIIESLFQGREILSRKCFYNKYYLESEIPLQIVTKVIDLLEFHLGTELSRLHKDDSFSSNLNYFFQIDDMLDVVIVSALEEAFFIKITDDDAQNVTSVDDLIKLVYKKLSHQVFSTE